MKNTIRLSFLILILMSCESKKSNNSQTTDDSKVIIAKIIIEDDNLFAINSEGIKKQLTFNKSDKNPILSEDSQKVIFIRSVEERNQYTNYKRYKLMEVNIENLLERTITDKKPYADGLDNSYEILHIINPTISLDTKYIYFVTEKYATSNQLVRVNLENGKWKELFATENYELVKKGAYKGLFLISKSEIRDKGRAIYFMICNEEGKTLKDFKDEASFNDFKNSIK
ncbi:hypothetical protein IMCC3317_45410 [Kordia antarctica]|uniref:Protein TolB n=1 Tax=Kordia antarctica TaxID=1218801 RepID=A0A7L4ZRP7_9FLAO|nr:PD40 domain-containing protein [Kordia antarctica]QHI39140.1 hypothetical protein IMCC3317_45410 [Kordia antarctica]